MEVVSCKVKLRRLLPPMLIISSGCLASHLDGWAAVTFIYGKERYLIDHYLALQRCPLWRSERSS